MSSNRVFNRFSKIGKRSYGMSLDCIAIT
nr:hypothetical protein [Orientia tsutsugamushi]